MAFVQCVAILRRAQLFLDGNVLSQSILLEYRISARPLVYCRDVRGYRARNSSVSIGGSVVECSPATRAARVRFPADARPFGIVSIA